MTDDNINPFGQDLAFDLRQIYARLVGMHMADAYDARKNNDYPKYFKALKDLYIVIKHKFKKPKDQEPEYDRLIGKAVDSFNKHSSTYFRTNRTREGVAEIEQCLNEIEIFLYEIMDDANMFGSNKKVQGL